MVAPSSSEKDTLATLITIAQAESTKWDQLYKKDPQFRLYYLSYDGWRYTVYGDDLSKVESSLTLKWSHSNGDINRERHYRKFHALKEYLEKEGLFAE